MFEWNVFFISDRSILTTTVHAWKIVVQKHQLCVLGTKKLLQILSIRQVSIFINGHNNRINSFYVLLVYVCTSQWINTLLKSYNYIIWINAYLRFRRPNISTYCIINKRNLSMLHSSIHYRNKYDNYVLLFILECQIFYFYYK